MGYSVQNGLVLGSVVQGSRTLNSAGFQPNVNRPVLVCYNISIAASTTLIGGATGTVELRSDSNSTPTNSRVICTNTLSQTLGLGVGLTSTSNWALTYIVPPGDYVRLVSTGTATMTIVDQYEITL